MPAPKHHDVIVIGAGFGGLGMGIELKHRGRDDFIIVEKNVGVGGTWHANRYPGAVCDIPSLLYSFSFAPTSAWTQTYPGQAECYRFPQIHHQAQVTISNEDSPDLLSRRSCNP